LENDTLLGLVASIQERQDVVDGLIAPVMVVLQLFRVSNVLIHGKRLTKSCDRQISITVLEKGQREASHAVCVLRVQFVRFAPIMKCLVQGASLVIIKAQVGRCIMALTKVPSVLCRVNSLTQCATAAIGELLAVLKEPIVQEQSGVLRK